MLTIVQSVLNVSIHHRVEFSFCLIIVFHPLVIQLHGYPYCRACDIYVDLSDSLDSIIASLLLLIGVLPPS